MTNHWLRVVSTLAATGGLLLPYSANAAAPSVGECLAASDNSLKLNSEHKLRAERDQLLICAAESCPADVRLECAKRVEQVNQALPSIVFDVKDGTGADVTAVKVTMDGELIADRLIGTALPIDPGEHTFTFEIAGQPPLTRQLVIRVSEQNRRESIALPAPNQTPALPALNCNAIYGVSDHELAAAGGTTVHTGGSTNNGGSSSSGGSSATTSTAATSTAAGGTAGRGASSGGVSSVGGSGTVTSTATGGTAAGGTSNMGTSSSIGGSTNVGGTGPAATTNAGGGSAVGGTTAAPACTPACTSPQVCSNGTCVDCLSSDAPRCSGNNTPIICDKNKWVPQTPCSGQTPACSNGVCAAAKLSGGIVAVGTPVLSNNSVRLVEHGLEYTPTICGTLQNKTVCVSGRIRP